MYSYGRVFQHQYQSSGLIPMIGSKPISNSNNYNTNNNHNNNNNNTTYSVPTGSNNKNEIKPFE